MEVRYGLNIPSIIRPCEKSVWSIRSHLKTLSFGILHRFIIWILWFARSKEPFIHQSPSACVLGLCGHYDACSKRVLSKSFLELRWEENLGWMSLFQIDCYQVAICMLQVFYLVPSPWKNNLLKNEIWWFHMIGRLKISFREEVRSLTDPQNDLQKLTSSVQ